VDVALGRAAELTQAKGGAYFTDATSPIAGEDFAAFCQAVGARAIIDFNGYTDTDPDTAQNMVQAAQTAGMTVDAWEISDEPYFYPAIFAGPAAYLNATFSPYFTQINATDPSATVSVFYEGQYSGVTGNGYQLWDTGIQNYTPPGTNPYWQGASMHIYPMGIAPNAQPPYTAPDVSTEEQTLNGVLAGTNAYFSSYVTPLIGENTPLFISELNSDPTSSYPFEGYMYNAIFLAEFIARVSTVPNLQGVGVTALYLGNTYNEGVIRAVNDYENYLIAQVLINPNYSTDTSTNPNTQFSFYYSTAGTALEVLNTAVNGSNATYATTMTGGPTVPVISGNPVPALFAQGFQAISNGTRFLIVTNKSNTAVPFGVEVNGVLGPPKIAVAYISGLSDVVQNTAADPSAVTVVNDVWSNPMTIPPYSVVRLEW
jgi:hypothetical protein